MSEITEYSEALDYVRSTLNCSCYPHLYPYDATCLKHAASDIIAVMVRDFVKLKQQNESTNK